MIFEALELKLYDDGTGNLNFWDSISGRDVIARIDDEGNLFIDELGVEGEIESSRPISFKEYMKMVKKSVEERKD